MTSCCRAAALCHLSSVVAARGRAVADGSDGCSRDQRPDAGNAAQVAEATHVRELADRSVFDLLQQRKIKPLVAQRIPLAEARRAHEVLGQGGVTGKLVLVCETSRARSVTE